MKPIKVKQPKKVFNYPIPEPEPEPDFYKYNYRHGATSFTNISSSILNGIYTGNIKWKFTAYELHSGFYSLLSFREYGAGYPDLYAGVVVSITLNGISLQDRHADTREVGTYPNGKITSVSTGDSFDLELNIESNYAELYVNGALYGYMNIHEKFTEEKDKRISLLTYRGIIHLQGNNPLGISIQEL